MINTCLISGDDGGRMINSHNFTGVTLPEDLHYILLESPW